MDDSSIARCHFGLHKDNSTDLVPSCLELFTVIVLSTAFNTHVMDDEKR